MKRRMKKERKTNKRKLTKINLKMRTVRRKKTRAKWRKNVEGRREINMIRQRLRILMILLKSISPL
jgi:hypothetical protein